MDPADRVIRRIVLNQAGEGDVAPMLGPDESLATYTLTLSPEAVALGLTIIEAGIYAPVVNDTSITFWLEVDEAMRDNPAFSASGGARLGMELTFTTNADPAPRYQRTLVQRVAQL